MTDLAYLSVAEGARLLRTRALSPVEWTKALLDRIAAIDAHYNAFIAVTADRALAQAKTAEAEIASGKSAAPYTQLCNMVLSHATEEGSGDTVKAIAPAAGTTAAGNAVRASAIARRRTHQATRMIAPSTAPAISRSQTISSR